MARDSKPEYATPIKKKRLFLKIIEQFNDCAKILDQNQNKKGRDYLDYGLEPAWDCGSGDEL